MPTLGAAMPEAIHKPDQDRRHRPKAIYLAQRFVTRGENLGEPTESLDQLLGERSDIPPGDAVGEEEFEQFVVRQGTWRLDQGPGA